MKNTKDEIVTKNTSKISELEQYQQYQDLYKAAEDNHRKDTKRIYIFLYAYSLLLLQLFGFPSFL